MKVFLTWNLYEVTLPISLIILHCQENSKKFLGATFT